MNNDAIIYCSKKNFKNKIDGLLLNDSLTRRTLHSSLEEAIGSIVSWEVLVVVTTHNYNLWVRVMLCYRGKNTLPVLSSLFTR